ncbi:NAD(P)/FAD-dependent oxidoreductase [Variovorax sp. J31P207]|uniref:NAD(P)/FAD-dependent oxidoreductase n=1 Tax=Variovorax sp. J31P207 TaxID=3053510 RepID=UPI002575313A|nr:NAD(P)/FAD-dependent oxidoreductase [Variovorax sp. J31P207]MDM0071765.1 NAD(P)/FAD-dependent oxidoreductase [Variovorax sp. J31P207]
MTDPRPLARPRAVILGGGFAGVAAARELRFSGADVLLIDRRNHHIFQPLLYQVATAVLAPADIAAPLRQLAEQQDNLSVMLGEVSAVDRQARTLTVAPAGIAPRTIPYDYLVVATGVQSSYFGHEEFAPHAPSLKTLADAEAIRARILSAYERAEQSDDMSERLRAMTFVLVGAGPTGVELAASMAQMARETLRRDFRRIDPAETRIFLVEAGPRALASFDESLARKSAARLEELGVQVRTGTRVDTIDANGVLAGGERIDAATVLWTAGVQASPLVAMLGTKTDRAGRACVAPGLHLPEDDRVFVVGDAASVETDGQRVPAVAQAAIQQGRHAGRAIANGINQSRMQPPPFRYNDRGNMAVVGRNSLCCNVVAGAPAAP